MIQWAARWTLRSIYMLTAIAIIRYLLTYSNRSTDTVASSFEIIPSPNSILFGIRSVQDKIKGKAPILQSSIYQADNIHLLTQWYFDANPIRRRELCEALMRNLLNPVITRIHLIQPANEFQPQSQQGPLRLRDEILEALQNEFPNETSRLQDAVNGKLEIVVTENSGRLIVADCFEYASIHLRGMISIFSNLDIYFDETLSLLYSNKSDLSFVQTYFLSRYETAENEDQSAIGTQCGDKFIGSHDSIVFIPPLPRALIENCRYRVGSWGIEARLMWEFDQFGVSARNPCYDIKSWHSHKSGVKNEEMPEVNMDQKSMIAYPDFFERSVWSSYPWENERIMKRRLISSQQE